MIPTSQIRNLHSVLCEPPQSKVQQLHPQATPEEAIQCALNQVEAALNTVAAIGLNKPELLQYRADDLQDIAERLTSIAQRAQRPGLLSRWFGKGDGAP
jgi:phosphoenolpyruvate-protein kinase (PTS system EI component)